mmetsp:Transcript_100956/g.301204  ORF Transcript_100956/g.301204 Transcript_100956/m.301204 type:complete len:331 (+) Transcript_100956:577-1569(+)
MPMAAQLLATPAPSCSTMEVQRPQFASRELSGSSLYKPWSSRTSLGSRLSFADLAAPSAFRAPSALGMGIDTSRLPGCGSQWTKPKEKIMAPKASTRHRAMDLATCCAWASPFAAASQIEAMGTPWTKSIVSRRRLQYWRWMPGTITRSDSAGCREKNSRERSALSASRRKSSSRATLALSSSMAQAREKPSSLKAVLASRSSHRTMCRSLATMASMSLCCTFTATSAPVCSRALWTCASDALPTGSASNSSNGDGFPVRLTPGGSRSSLRRAALTSARGRAGARSWSCARTSAYSSGTAGLKVAACWPSFVKRPPLARQSSNARSAQRL